MLGLHGGVRSAMPRSRVSSWNEPQTAYRRANPPIALCVAELPGPMLTKFPYLAILHALASGNFQRGKVTTAIITSQGSLSPMRSSDSTLVLKSGISATLHMEVALDIGEATVAQQCHSKCFRCYANPEAHEFVNPTEISHLSHLEPQGPCIVRSLLHAKERCLSTTRQSWIGVELCRSQGNFSACSY
jgi:hypothetical protein